jgi:hypothetical protein
LKYGVCILWAASVVACGGPMGASDGGANRDVAPADARAIALSSSAERTSHERGTNCAMCHSAEGFASGFFTLAGTVSRVDDTPLPGVTVEVRTAPGAMGDLLTSAVSDREGNFYNTQALPEPARPMFVSLVSPTGTRRAMPFPTMSAQCNFCHVGRQRFRM